MNKGTADNKQSKGRSLIPIDRVVDSVLSTNYGLMDPQGVGEKAVYRDVIFRVFSVVMTVIALLLAACYYVVEEPRMGQFNLVLGLVFLVHSVLLLITARRLLHPIIMVILSVSIYLAAFIDGQHYIVYGALPIIVLFYLILQPRMALFFSALWVPIISAIGATVLDFRHTIAFVICLVLFAVYLQFSASLLIRLGLGLKKLAVKDPLTNAYNRRSMMDSLEYAVAMHERYATPSAVVMIDLDHFKEVNDEYGHQAGDRALNNLVATLSRRLRKTDRLCRYGGEEFVAILNGIDLPQAVELAESFCAQVRDTELIPQSPLTISCGVALIQSGENAAEWLQRCDTALYSAKASGRDRVAVDSLAPVETTV